MFEIYRPFAELIITYETHGYVIASVYIINVRSTDLSCFRLHCVALFTFQPFRTSSQQTDV